MHPRRFPEVNLTQMENKKMETPTLDKMKFVQRESQAIGSFLEWLKRDKGVSLMHTVFDEGSGRGVEIPFSYNIEKLLAEYFEIDLNEAEKEKRAILEDLQSRCNNGTVSHYQ